MTQLQSEQILQFNQNTFWYWAHLLSFIFVVNPLCYLLVNYVLNKIDPTFHERSYREKCYAIKNISKSAILSLLVLYCFPMFVEITMTDVWPTSLMIILGNVYVSTDVTALFFVPELPYNTKIHHTTVLILGIINTFANYHVDGIHRAMTYLTFFSMIPYIVNTRLGLRFINVSDETKRTFSQIAVVVYGFSIFCNFTIQNYYIFFKNQINLTARILYFIVYYLILNDDILLLNYLIKSSTGSSIKEHYANLTDSQKRMKQTTQTTQTAQTQTQTQTDQTQTAQTQTAQTDQS